LEKKLKLQGILHIATDWEDYANHINIVLKNNPAFTKLETPVLSERLPTKFEQRGKKQGRKIIDMLFIINKKSQHLSI